MRGRHVPAAADEQAVPPHEVCSRGARTIVGRCRDGLQREAAVGCALDHHEAPAGDAPHRGDGSRRAALCGRDMLSEYKRVEPHHPRMLGAQVLKETVSGPDIGVHGRDLDRSIAGVHTLSDNSAREPLCSSTS